MSNWIHPTSLAALTLLALACSGRTVADESRPDAGSGAVDAGVSAATACEVYARSDCQKLAACWPLEVEASFGDLDICVAQTAVTCRSLFTSQARGTADGLLACAAAVRASDCGPILDHLSGPPECAALVGDLATGARCSSAWECASGCCLHDEVTGCRRCWEKFPEGAACTTEIDCDRGLVCSFAGTCARPRQVGEACAADRPCLRELSCVASACAVSAESGEPCDPTLQNCNVPKGLICNPLTLQCEQVARAAPGQACGNTADGGYAVCIAGSGCDDPQGVAGVCQGPLALGATCDPLAWPACAYPAECVLHRCQDASTCIGK